ncbi:serine hydrolase domain-containing protein [Symbioplanes lichenis]|uniref:serine hydrolase domain-containing protein n=1 Tax=Symbioplanes lichenis TaxID=1629072 RepID=UPI00273A39C0|nr:serine hydrolase domain-containing protein [Actinoplanes lichenis]
MSGTTSRRTVLRAAAVAAAAGPLAAAHTTSASARGKSLSRPAAVRDLVAFIEARMAAYDIPGVAVGVRYRGTDHAFGLGVTNIADPAPVDADTVFRVASTSKTFTGTAVMRLVERGRIDLDRRVRHYLPDFRVADERASERVTVRQILNHSAGWLGDFFLDTGSDDAALARYVEGMARLPQLTPPGQVMHYNNAALSLAGRVIEAVTGTTYERAVHDLLLAPLRLDTSAFTLGELPGATVAVPHLPDATGELVPVPAAFDIPRSINPAGGLISSARDQLRWAGFHLGDGRVPGGGRRLLTERSLRAMRSRPGPGGTLYVEIDGFGVTWMIRPTAEGPKVFQHGGDWDGQHSGFLIVPERDFALTVLTNSETGPLLTLDLFADDWALDRFLGLHNLPAVPRSLPARELAPYAGSYTARQIGFQGEEAAVTLDIAPGDGQLVVSSGGVEALRLVFYRRDHVLVLYPDGSEQHIRAIFGRDADGGIAWFRYGGRLYVRGPATLAARSSGKLPRPGTLPYPAR